MENIISLHKNEYISSPEVVVEAPGSVTVIGNHVDSDDGFMIQALLDMKLFVSMSKRKDNSFRFYAVDYAEKRKTSASNIKYKKEDRWANYIKSVLYSMETTGIPLKGVDITVTGNIPQGIGLASSSAIESAISVGLSGLYNLNLSNEQIVKIIYDGENRFLNSIKIPSGIFAPLYGKEGNLVFVDLRSKNIEYIPFSQKDTVFVITVSNVPLIKFDKELEERRKDINKCIEKLKMIKPGNCLRDYSKTDISNIGAVPEQIKRRSIHVIDEMARAEEAKTAIKKENMVALGKLMNRSHESLRDNFEVSCPEIDWLVKRAQEIDGVYGSKITGTGFGGCTLTLLKKSALGQYKERLDEYERIFGFKADMINCSMPEGVKSIYTEENSPLYKVEQEIFAE
jgi:galactokinase